MTDSDPKLNNETFGDVTRENQDFFDVPEWAIGAVGYQIFPDRFKNGDETNDVVDGEYFYATGHARKAAWDEPVGRSDIRTFYGGDLEGIIQELDYIQSLGVEVVYLNPIFVSPSSHKYDTQDYEHVDPHFGRIVKDGGRVMENWETHNGFAPKYIVRATDEANLEASDAVFARLCEEIHHRGMRIVLDGVFNHSGSFNKWMDAEGIYVGAFNETGDERHKGAWQSRESGYRDFYRFGDFGKTRGAKYNEDIGETEADAEARDDCRSEYEGWWGYRTLPKFDYEGSESLCRKIIECASKWVRAPYCIDGWRLDVAADLGHSEEFNHRFWKRFVGELRKINPDLLFIAEHYGNPKAWLECGEWSSVMNYDGFMEPVTYFLTGMEKHSDGRRDDLYNNGPLFFEAMGRAMGNLPGRSLYSAMNELSNHDHSRFLTRTGGRTGRLETHGSEAASADVSMDVMREASAILFTWPGAPTIYYGDEAGLTGWTDPDSRRPYPWGREDHELIDFYRKLGALHNKYDALKRGRLVPLYDGANQPGVIAYARVLDELSNMQTTSQSTPSIVTIINNSDIEQKVDLEAVFNNSKLCEKVMQPRLLITSRRDNIILQENKIMLAPKTASVFAI